MFYSTKYFIVWVTQCRNTNEAYDHFQYLLKSCPRFHHTVVKQEKLKMIVLLPIATGMSQIETLYKWKADDRLLYENGPMMKFA